MHPNNVLIYVVVPAWMFTSCIHSYDPDILAEDEKKYVISGQVTDEGGLQTINVSISSPVETPHFIPANDCKVKIYDDRGNVFPMSRRADGNYQNTIDPFYLKPGVAFKVEVFTHDGDYIESDYDTLTRGPEVDSVYYIRDEKIYNQAAPPVMGIQFYMDHVGAPSDSRYYRLEAIETWEYHAPYALEWYYDGSVHHVTPPDSSLMVCWKTVRLPEIFTMTTDNLVGNIYDHFRLHFVNNIRAKLYRGYSLLVKQYSLTHETFIYFENLRVNSNPDGGLYEKQPLAIRGNMHNTTHPEKEVLGFFSASSVHSKRIFVNPIPDLPFLYEVVCEPQGFLGFGPHDYLVYLLGDAYGWHATLDDQCVDCQYLGGVIIKPDFWPN